MENNFVSPFKEMTPEWGRVKLLPAMKGIFFRKVINRMIEFVEFTLKSSNFEEKKKENTAYRKCSNSIHD